MNPERSIAYFSMEIGLEGAMPTYSGGLGVLAGDSIRSAADMEIPLVAVTLVHRQGYFFQRIDAQGVQTEEPVAWAIDDYLTLLGARVTVVLEGRPVQIAAWQYDVVGIRGSRVPVILLDTDVPENDAGDRTITHHLYGGDARYRLMQEAVLGVGGVRMLAALGYDDLQRFHMNEGHASLLALELLHEEAKTRQRPITDPTVIHAVCQKCVFTTHTPVAAGHDKFPMDLAVKVLDPSLMEPFRSAEGQRTICCDGVLNMTFLGFSFSHYINGVAKRHGEVSRQMFGDYPIDAITNGVHAATWVSAPFAALFDKRVPGWREDNFNLRYAVSVDPDEVWQAHRDAKRTLLQRVNRESNAGLDFDMLTIGYARRATAYKQPDLILRDVSRFKRMSAEHGPIQLVFAGKAHPNDRPGKELIRKIVGAMESLRPEVRAGYLANYDMDLCRLMVSGVDLWLNTPKPPMEASGTSGMKAALNGVPSFSVLDGWWLEGCIEGYTGWGIGPRPARPSGGAGDAAPTADRAADDAVLLYQKLEDVILPMYYNNRPRYIEVMRHTIAVNGSFFNTQRMMQHYATKAYVV